MGSGYTVEGQVTGEEKSGGIQIEVTPSYRKHGYVFWYMAENGRSRKTMISEDSTPRGQSLGGGSTIYMELPKSRPAKLSDFFETREQLAEIDCLILDATMSKPFARTSSLSSEYFASGAHSCSRPMSLHRIIYFTGLSPMCSSPLSVQCLLHSSSEKSRTRVPSPAVPHDTPTPRRTQPEVMGLAAGGKLIQDLVVDRNPSYIWNASRTRLINLHIFSPASFEAVTHIVPPETPITARAYADAGLPFYVVEEDIENRLDGSDTLDAVKSVSQMDKQIGVDDCGAPSLDTKAPKRCGVCKIRLCDCMCVIPPPNRYTFPPLV